MKFKPITDTAIEAEILEQDYAQAKRFGRTAVGGQCIYYTGMLQTGYLPLSEIVWAYLRQEDCEGKMCCGRMGFSSYFLMATMKGGKQKKTNLERAEDVKAILELLKERNPAMEVGYSKEKAEKYLGK